jgi:hypothetical protein
MNDFFSIFRRTFLQLPKIVGTRMGRFVRMPMCPLPSVAVSESTDVKALFPKNHSVVF